MAFNFIALSQTCKRKIGSQMLLRLEGVIGFMADSYKMNKNRDGEYFQAIVSILKQKGITYSRSNYNSDKVRIRQAFLALSVGNKSFKPHKSAEPIIKCLAADGIKTWADVERIRGEAGKKGAGEEEEKREEEISGEPAQPVGQMPPTSRQKFLGSISVFMDGAESILEENESLLAQNEKLSEENRRLLDLSGGNDDYVIFLEKEVESLRNQLESARGSIRSAHGEALERIAQANPAHYKALMLVVEKLGAEKDEQRDRVNKVMGDLPREFNWQSEKGEIVYESYFCKSLQGFVLEEQSRIVEALNLLAQEGSEYPSLRTKKYEARIPFSPAGCMASRATDEIRFSWKKNGAVVIYNVYRRSDTRLRQSER